MSEELGSEPKGISYPKGVKTAIEKRLYRALIPKNLGGSGEDPISVISIAKTLPPEQVTHPLLKEVMENAVNIPIVKDELKALIKGKRRGVRERIIKLLENVHFIKKVKRGEKEEDDEEEESGSEFGC